ncbi:rhodanese-like domain-containing protein [Verrucomicrobiota bacterium]
MRMLRHAVGPVLLLVLGAWFARAGGEDKLVAYRQRVRAKYAAVRQVSTTALGDWLSDTNRTPPVLLDVREKVEYEVSHLTGATLAPKKSGLRALVEGLGEQTPVVVYCSVGMRSSALAIELQKAGHTNVFNLDGSIFQWANEGRPVFQGTNEVNSVHPYNRKWGRFLKEELRARVPPVK